MKHKNYN